MSDTDLRDQLMTLLLAGHETTATALAWTFDLLLRHPAALARLRDSLEAGEEDYLRATITESLRLRPVVPLAGRRLAKELVADGLTLPAGTDVTPAIWLTHTRADVYPEPFAFRPERFLEDGPDTYAWIPFGGGVRRCIGAAFAEFEMRIVLREVLTRCELHKAEPGAGAGRPPQRHPLAAGRHPGRRSPPATRRASASSARGLGSSAALAPAGVPWPSARSCPSRRSPRRRRGRGSAPRWCRSAPSPRPGPRRGCPRSRASAGSRRPTLSSYS